MKYQFLAKMLTVERQERLLTKCLRYEIVMEASRWKNNKCNKSWQVPRAESGSAAYTYKKSLVPEKEWLQNLLKPLLRSHIMLLENVRWRRVKAEEIKQRISVRYIYITIKSEKFFPSDEIVHWPLIWIYWIDVNIWQSSWSRKSVPSLLEGALTK